MPTALRTLLRLAAAAVLALLPLLLQAADPRDPYEHFFQPTFGNFQEELQEARAEGRKAMLIFFGMEDCHVCHRMKQQVLSQPEVQDYFREHFAVFSVDVVGDIEITDFQGNTMRQADFAFHAFRVRATPVFQFFDLDGEPIVRFTGATRDAMEFLQLGEFVADGHYQQVNFTQFRRDAR